MSPEPKMSATAPFKWVGCIVLDPKDVKGLLRELPKASDYSAQLQDTAQAAAELARQLNQIERGEAA
jgi:hypothetical protein